MLTELEDLLMHSKKGRPNLHPWPSTNRNGVIPSLWSNTSRLSILDRIFTRMSGVILPFSEYSIRQGIDFPNNNVSTQCCYEFVFCKYDDLPLNKHFGPS